VKEVDSVLRASPLVVYCSRQILSFPCYLTNLDHGKLWCLIPNEPGHRTIIIIYLNTFLGFISTVIKYLLALTKVSSRRLPELIVSENAISSESGRRRTVSTTLNWICLISIFVSLSMAKSRCINMHQEKFHVCQEFESVNESGERVNES